MSDGTNGAVASENYAIGISFGNSYSSIAHISAEGKIEVIANEEGDRQIPSILSYVDGEEYHGTQAKAQLVRNAKNSIAYFKDYIGKAYSGIDPSPCKTSAHPTEANGKVVFTVQDKEEGEPSALTVSEVTTRHLRKLRDSAADFVGKKITAAVVTVPTDTTADQKAALAAAAKEADLEILQFIHEPVASLLAYDSRAQEVPDRIIVVADFGATRSDATVISCTGGGLYSILATTHDYELGGKQLDQVLIDHFAKEFEKKHKSDPRKNERSLAKLTLEAEAVKKALSQSASATFSVESLADGVDFRSTVNRTRYQLLSVKTFQKFTRMVEELLKKADLDVLDVDQVILSGGTSHTPKIAENIQALFPETTTVLSPATSNASLNPSELQARGAALQASMVQEFEKEDIEQSTHEMVTVTPHTTYPIGVQVTGQSEEYTVIVPAVTAVPARKTKTIAVPEGDVLLVVSEGERSIKVTTPEPKPETNGTKDDSDDDSEEDEEEDIREKVFKAKNKLAEFEFKGLKKGAKLEVTVNIDQDLGVQITAREAGGKGGVRGVLAAPQPSQNGSA